MAIEPAFSKLPNELLLNIIAPLSPADLRCLSQVDRRLLYFVSGYLAPFQVGLTALPNELVLEIVAHLESKHKSRLARTSHRFYPLVMDSIIRSNMQKKGLSLLRFAARHNLRGLARRILHRGGDVNAEWKLKNGMKATAITYAAVFGFGQMVKLLLNSGASQIVENKYRPLSAALAKGHEHVALRLLRDLEAAGKLHGKVSAAYLEMAAGLKLVKVVQYVLEQTPRPERTNGLDASLYSVLAADACKGDIYKRELHQDAYQIVELLLQHGADADVSSGISKRPQTSREISARHPDPRVRALLSKAVRASRPKDLPLQIGRSWNGPSSSSLLSASPTDEGYEVSLWDFLEGPDGHALIGDDEHEHELTGSNVSNEHDDHISFNTREALEDHEDMYGSKESKAEEPPPLTSYPQLAAPKRDVQPAANKLWANASPAIRSAPPTLVPQKTSRRATPKPQKNQVEAKAVPEEQFPVLENTNKKTTAQGKHFPIEKLGQKTTQAVTGKELWAALPKNGDARDKKEAPRKDTKESAEEDGVGKKGLSKRKKKKEWQPLVL